MSTAVKIESREGAGSIEFCNVRRDPSGLIHCKIAVSNVDFHCAESLSFHPGEADLVGFFRGVFTAPPIYRTDREFAGDTVKGVRFIIGTHDDSTNVALTVWLDSAHWHARSCLVFPQGQFGLIADELSELFQHDRSG